MDSECVSCGACVQACPTATLSEKIAHREGPGRAQRRDDLRLLRRRLLVPRRDAGRGSGAHGAEQGRPRQPRPLLREGPLRHRLRDAQGPHHEADDPRARSPIRGARCPGRRPSPTPPASSSASRPSTAATRSAASPPRAAPTRKPTSCRSWCAPASATTTSIPARACATRPTGYGLKKTLGESAGTQNFDSVMKADVIIVIGANPDRRPSGVRLADEAAAARGREADRRRSAPHRPGAHAARRGRLSPAAAARHQRRADQRRSRTSSSPRAWSRRTSCASAARPTPSRSGARSSPRRAIRRRPWRRSPACPPPTCAPPRACTPPAATAPSTTASASPSTARARPWSWASPTSPWRPATSAARAWASTRCAARTTCRARATWARSRTSSPATATSRTTRCAHCSRATGA